jgi:iron(III) transport system substrate-binding protein
MDLFAAVVCYNTVEGQKKNIPQPKSWADLTKPVYKGQITMPNPASSGTGFFDVTAWLQTMGEANGWKYMDQLHENIAQYTHSGSKPCRQAGRGRVRGRHLVRLPRQRREGQGRAGRARVPEGGAGLGPRGLGHREDHEEDGRGEEADGLDATKEANQAYAKNFAIVAHPR